MVHMRREVARVPYDPGRRGAATQADGRAAVLTGREHAKGSLCKTQRRSARSNRNALWRVRVAACTPLSIVEAAPHTAAAVKLGIDVVISSAKPNWLANPRSVQGRRPLGGARSFPRQSAPVQRLTPAASFAAH